MWGSIQWRLPRGAQNDDLSALTLGINTNADTTNRLSVASDATLLTHAGDDHRLKLNKATTTDAASLLFQSGFMGHAEMGLTGSNDFALRVSTDGTTFRDALSANAATGALTAPADINFGETTLNHYQKGSGIPELTFGGDDTDMAYVANSGQYLRTGNLVVLHCAIVLAQKGTATGVAEIQNLPFNASPLYYAGEMIFVSGGAGLTVPKCRTLPGNKLQLFNSNLDRAGQPQQHQLYQQHQLQTDIDTYALMPNPPEHI